jgi:adenylosuccinate synthase
MRSHIAVIGAGFGDEGKGQMVDYIASRGDHDIVVRYNGGSQCGHTVVTPDGKRHIFSQIGSGAIHNMPTHLSRFVYVNPVYLLRELIVFEKTFGFIPKISMSPRTNFVLPWDIHYNQKNEQERGNNRHGSTGHGIFNAVKRSIWPDFRLTAEIAFEESKENLYLRLNLFNEPFEPQDLGSYGEAIHSLRKIGVELKNDRDIIRDHLCIFEGGQGLLLDQNSGFFPHVTPSNTGLTNIISLLSNSIDRGIERVKPIYVTRSFLTRHGNGPMYYPQYEHPNNYTGLERSNLTDDTNVHNAWQGNMRYGKLNLTQLHAAIQNDYFQAHLINDEMILSPKLAITWSEAFPAVTEELCKNFSVFSVARERTRDDIVV